MWVTRAKIQAAEFGAAKDGGAPYAPQEVKNKG